MKINIKWFLFLCVFLISANLYANDIGLRIPDTTAVVNDILYIPVYVDSSLTGENVYSYQLQISFYSSLLSAESIVTTGTISESFSMSFNNTILGRLRLQVLEVLP